VANWQVARLVTDPIKRIHPAFVMVSIDIHDPLVATILGSIVSLTPGTVTADIDMQSALLYVHALNAGDAQHLIVAIKTRSEAPLKEIFAC
jgi:multicomponent K+:H+ antiporter subunit E